EDAVHSPILGDHTNMLNSLYTFTKWIGGWRAGTREAQELFSACGVTCQVVDNSDETELLKLLCLAKYGLSIVFNKYESELFKRCGFMLSDLKEWDQNYNRGLTIQGR